MKKVETKAIICLFALLISAGCSTMPQRHVLQESETLNPMDISGLRFWDESAITVENYDLAAELASITEKGAGKGEINHLALSGGGVNGAFSAGILNAWSELGTRPDFNVVTGVSTGAIVSIFAFLGSEYDQELYNYYTQTSIGEMFKRNSLLTLPFNHAMIDTSGFENIVRAAIDTPLVKKLAKERQKGRVLLISTTNLDNEKMAIWDIGKIAQVGTVEAQRLIQDIIIASSAVPGAFPAKRIALPYNGSIVEELHVDGGVSRQVFLFPQKLKNRTSDQHVSSNIYVIRNGHLKPEFEEVEHRFTSVSIRSISILIRRQGIADIEHIYRFSERNQLGFNLAYIDSDFDKDDLKLASQDYLKAIYSYGYEKMIQQEVWSTLPPSVL
ncbi:patatin-like phospholipase family protein [Vibrio astriarenae]